MLSSIGPTVRKETTLQNGIASTEFIGAKDARKVVAYVVISSPSSLVGGALKLEMYQPATNTWVGMPQKVSVIASGGGTPAVVNSNTASATAVVGGSAINTTGVTTITNTATVVLEAEGLGTNVRFAPSATSGTATMAFSLVSVP